MDTHQLPLLPQQPAIPSQSPGLDPGLDTEANLHPPHDLWSPFVEGLEDYFQLPIGDLPPVDKCIAANKTELAAVPIRTAGNMKAIHRHFFSEDDAAENARPLVHCRVDKCFYEVLRAYGTGVQLHHIKTHHQRLIHAVIAFRIAQGDPAFDQTHLV
jgi:hypothetical protein